MDAPAGIDVIGDVHGCTGELQLLLAHLGYRQPAGRWQHPGGRRAVFLGDLVDRGPDNVGALLLVDQLVQDGCALIGSIGNHDLRLYEWLLLGIEPRTRAGGMTGTIAEIEAGANVKAVLAALERLFAQAPAFSCFGELVVVHAALRPEMLELSAAPGRLDELSQLCAFGETTGEVDERGRQVRTFGWVSEWLPPQTVAFGHNVCGQWPVRYGQGNVYALDTGCVFGGSLSCLRWPERELVSLPAERRYTDDTPVLVSGVEPYLLPTVTVAERPDWLPPRS